MLNKIENSEIIPLKDTLTINRLNSRNKKTTNNICSIKFNTQQILSGGETLYISMWFDDLSVVLPSDNYDLPTLAIDPESSLLNFHILTSNFNVGLTGEKGDLGIKGDKGERGILEESRDISIYKCNILEDIDIDMNIYNNDKYYYFSLKELYNIRNHIIIDDIYENKENLLINETAYYKFEISKSIQYYDITQDFNIKLALFKLDHSENIYKIIPESITTHTLITRGLNTKQYKNQNIFLNKSVYLHKNDKIKIGITCEDLFYKLIDSNYILPVIKLIEGNSIIEITTITNNFSVGLPGIKGDQGIQGNKGDMGESGVFQYTELNILSNQNIKSNSHNSENSYYKIQWEAPYKNINNYFLTHNLHGDLTINTYSGKMNSDIVHIGYYTLEEALIKLSINYVSMTYKYIGIINNNIYAKFYFHSGNTVNYDYNIIDASFNEFTTFKKEYKDTSHKLILKPGFYIIDYGLGFNNINGDFFDIVSSIYYNDNGKYKVYKNTKNTHFNKKSDENIYISNKNIIHLEKKTDIILGINLNNKSDFDTNIKLDLLNDNTSINIVKLDTNFNTISDNIKA